MELYLFHHEDFKRLYNCDNISVDHVPLAQRQSPILGSILMAFFVIFYILYIPCMLSFWKRLDNACYKFLFYIGIADLIVLWICGFETALFGLTGTVFCSSPMLIYFSGDFGNAIWAAESVAEAVLAFNRCLETIWPELAEKLFDGKRSWIWLVGITAYAIYWVFYMPPVLFSGIYFSWFFEPYIGGYRNATENYGSVLHSVHNLSLALLFPLIYICFAIALFVQKRMYAVATNNSVSQIDIAIIIQIFLISLINFTGASLYDYMQYVQVNQVLIVTATFSWFLVHGFPPVIYLLLNKTIRTDAKKLFNKIFHRPNQPTRLNGIIITPMMTGPSGMNNFTGTAASGTAPVATISHIKTQQRRRQPFNAIVPQMNAAA